MPNPQVPESSRRARHLYLVEIVLGLAFLGLIVAVIWSNRNSAKSTVESELIVKLTAANWQKEVLDSEVPVVVDFYAPWCGPCRMLSPIIDKLATQYAGKVKVGKINIDDAQDIATKYGILNIPRVYIFKGGDQPQR